ncbi:MAG: AsmA family protein, partial [Alphaproteobacteria bacterium]|nr:AsmA family protein [Alphaproteobacteria bacterium]
MRIARTIGFVIAGVSLLLVALVVGAVVALKFVDFNTYKPLVADEVRKVTGRELAISGDLRLDIGLTPGIVVNDVTLSNAEWGSRPDMVSVRRLEAKIVLTSLIFGVLEIDRIELTGADILLETDRQGRANFEFAPPGAAAEAAPQPEQAGSGTAAFPLVHEAEIRDSRLTYVSAATGATYSTVVDSLTLGGGGSDAPMNLVYAGSFKDTPVRATARLGSLEGLFDPGSPWPVEVAIDGGGATLTVKGAIADPLAASGIDLAIAVRGDRFDALSALAGRQVPALGSYSLAGRVTGDHASTIDISGLAVQVGGSDITGSANVTLSGEHPAVGARLASDRIDLAAFGAGNAPLRGAVAVFSLKDDRLFIDSLKAELSGAAVTVQGTIAEPARGGGLALSVVAKGERFSDLSELAGREMPALGGYAISTRLTGDATTKTRFSNIVAQLGKSDLEGYATVALTGGRPFFNAVLSSNNIDLAPLGGSEGDGGAGPQAATQTPDRLFPDDPLPLEELKAFDIGLRLDAATVTGRRVPWRNAALVLSLRNGLLDIESFRTELYDGAFSGAARIDARTEMAGLIARVTLRNVDLKPVLEEAAVAGALEGRINFDLDVAGRGNSVRQIMASLDGKVTLAMGKGRIRSRTLQTWVGGPRRILSNVLTLNVGGYTAVNCGLGVFDIRQGLATAGGLLLDTDVAAFGGTGTVNLRTEALDLIIDPKVKKTTLSAAVPVHVRGTLASPEYSLDTTAVARRVGGLLGALAFPPALILVLGELGTFKDGDCAGRAASTEDQTLPGGAEQTTEDQPPALPG